MSDKKSCPEAITRVSCKDYENLFGYYDKSPWNKAGDKLIYLRVPDARTRPASVEKAEIIMNDLTNGRESVIASTTAWNVQQGCMLQWLGPDYSSRILFNDCRNGRLVSVIKELETGGESLFDLPSYAVSSDGKTALSLDFSRLHTLRPGYGYANLEDKSKGCAIPGGFCVFCLDLVSGDVKGVLTYKELYALSPDKTMQNAFHKVNHLMINPSCGRFMFLHRWILNGVKYDRLIACDMQGGNLRVLLDDGMVSHCNWKNASEIITFANTREHGGRYYMLKDSDNPQVTVMENLPDFDGHPSFSFDGRYILTDSYPDFKRKQSLFLYDIKTGENKKIASVYSSRRYVNETRCDLHPRWKHDSGEICFDGASERRRQVYTLQINS